MQDAMQSVPSVDQETAALKLPPHSLEAEQSVLGGLMLDNQAWEHIADRLRRMIFIATSIAWCST